MLSKDREVIFAFKLGAALRHSKLNPRSGHSTLALYAPAVVTENITMVMKLTVLALAASLAAASDMTCLTPPTRSGPGRDVSYGRSPHPATPL